jgi:redox-sensing transcriptional repressor
MYRRLLRRLLSQGGGSVFSHELSQMAGNTAAQVRRDLMAVGALGSPAKGYDAEELMERIGGFLDGVGGQKVALVGIGNLGRAIMAYFTGLRQLLEVTAAFDNNEAKTDRVINGVRTYHTRDIEEVVRREKIAVGILTVPVDAAQSAADALVRAGVGGILNFAPVVLKTPETVFVEDMDMMVALEKVAYFARNGG